MAEEKSFNQTPETLLAVANEVTDLLDEQEGMKNELGGSARNELYINFRGGTADEALPEA